MQITDVHVKHDVCLKGVNAKGFYLLLYSLALRTLSLSSDGLQSCQLQSVLNVKATLTF